MSVENFDYENSYDLETNDNIIIEEKLREQNINIEQQLRNHVSNKIKLSRNKIYDLFSKYLNYYFDNNLYLDNDILESLLLENVFLFKIAADNLSNKDILKFLSYFNRDFFIECYSKFRSFPFPKDKGIYTYINYNFGIHFLELEKSEIICNKFLIAMLKHNEIKKIEQLLLNKKISYNHKLLDIMTENNQFIILINFFQENYYFIYDVFYKNKNEFNKLIILNNYLLKDLLLNKNINNEMLIYLLQNFEIDYETLKDYLETLYSDDYFNDAFEDAENTDDLKKLLPERIKELLNKNIIYDDENKEEGLTLKKF